MTRLEMVTEVCDTVGKSVDALSVSATTLKERVEDWYINWAQRRLARAHQFWELDAVQDSAATVDGVYKYPMVSGTNNLGLVRPRAIQSIRLIDSENSRMLQKKSYRYIDKYFPRPENYSEDRPWIYARHGNDLYLLKIPDAAYTLKIKYNQWAENLTADGQTSDFDEKDSLIITATTLETYLALQEYKDVEMWAERLKGQLYDVIDSERDDTDWEPKAEPFQTILPAIGIGTPWLDPFADIHDPLGNY